MESLYKLNQQMQHILDLYDAGVESYVDTDTGEIKPIGEVLDELALARDEKIDNCILYLKNLKAFERNLAESVASQQERLAAYRKRIANMEEYVVSQLGDIKKRETVDYKLTVRTTEAVVAPSKNDDVAKLPEQYRKETVTYAANKTAIKKAIKAGQEVPGCSIVINKHLKLG